MVSLSATSTGGGFETDPLPAAALGTKLSQYAKLERGDRRLSDPWIERTAAAYGIDPGEVVSAPANQVPILGTVEAGGVVRWLTGSPPASETRGALTVTAGTLGPLFDGALLLTACRRVEPASMVEGRPYLLLADRWLVRTVHAARRATWHLSGFNVSPSFDALISEAIVCEGLSF